MGRTANPTDPDRSQGRSGCHHHPDHNGYREGSSHGWSSGNLSIRRGKLQPARQVKNSISRWTAYRTGVVGEGGAHGCGSS